MAIDTSQFGDFEYWERQLNIFVTEQYMTQEDAWEFARFLVASWTDDLPYPRGEAFEVIRLHIRGRRVAMEETVRLAWIGMRELADDGRMEVRSAAAVAQMFSYIISDSAVTRAIALRIQHALFEGKLWGEDDGAAGRFLEGLYSNDWIGTFYTPDDREGDGYGNQWGLFWGS